MGVNGRSVSPPEDLLQEERHTFLELLRVAAKPEADAVLVSRAENRAWHQEHAPREGQVTAEWLGLEGHLDEGGIASLRAPPAQFRLGGWTQLRERPRKVLEIGACHSKAWRDQPLCMAQRD